MPRPTLPADNFPAVSFLEESFEDDAAARDLPLLKHVRSARATTSSPAVHKYRLCLPQMIIGIAMRTEPHDVFAQKTDASGAYPMHALLIANNIDAFDTALMIYKARPHLLAQTHSVGPFEGCDFPSSHTAQIPTTKPEWFPTWN